MAGDNFFDQDKPYTAPSDPWPEEPPPPESEDDYGQPRVLKFPSGEPVRKVNGANTSGIDILPPDFTDDALGLRFTKLFKNALKYVAAWDRWMIWDGQIWKHDNTLRTFDLIRQTVRAIGAEASEPKVKSALAAAKTVAAIEKLIRSDRDHAAGAEDWDTDPWLLNTPGGIVNLKTGDLMPHDPQGRMTKTTAVAPGGDCPRWLEFLNKVTGEDMLLAAYLKRVAGYCLTGMTVEHAMFFAYGTGRNGKGVFLNTLTRILGDYAKTASPETFTESGSGKHLTVLARLQGARLVVSQETDAGDPWAETRIKSVTGGDPITANYMRQDPFTFVPQFKLFISGNHKPSLKSVDEAIKARFNLVPFTVTIPPGERDPMLSEKLWEEAPGILAWAIEGCWDWQQARLKPPAIVTAATGDYFDSEDSVSLWMIDCCETGPHNEEMSGKLFGSWCKWAVQAGEKPGSHKAFSRALEKKGFTPGKHTRNGTPIKGLRLPVARSFQEMDHELDD